MCLQSSPVRRQLLQRRELKILSLLPAAAILSRFEVSGVSAPRFFLSKTSRPVGPDGHRSHCWVGDPRARRGSRTRLFARDCSHPPHQHRNRSGFTATQEGWLWRGRIRQAVFLEGLIRGCGGGQAFVLAHTASAVGNCQRRLGGFCPGPESCRRRHDHPRQPPVAQIRMLHHHRGTWVARDACLQMERVSVTTPCNGSD